MVVAAYRIEINGRDLTETWRRERRLLSIDVVDKLGASADACTLEIDDRIPRVAWPPVGSQLRLWLGVSEAKLTDLGTYTLDVPQSSGPPHLLSVTGHAENFVATHAAPLHTNRSRMWQRTTLADMAESIAAEHGLNSRVAAALQAINIGPLEQVDESNLSFLDRTARAAGGRVRARSGQLEVLPSGALSARPVLLGIRDLESWYAPLGMRVRPGRVTARWCSPKSGRVGEVSVGSGEPLLVLGDVHEDRDSAERACKAARDDAQREAGLLAISLTQLRTDIGAGSTVEVTGLRSELDGDWLASEVVHRVDATAGRTAITAQRSANQ